jgi:outer membrane protein OmpA-like peptidoglycan-associated protein
LKKIILSFILSFSLANACSTKSEVLAFDSIAAIQGAVIGGPVGAAWFLGLYYFADKNKCDTSIFNVIDSTKKLSVSCLDDSLDEPSISETFNSNISFDSLCSFNFDSSKVLNFIELPFDISNVESISIIGHTDPVGSSSYNYKLGIKRALSYKKILLLKYPSLTNKKITIASSGSNENSGFSSFSDMRRISLIISTK